MKFVIKYRNTEKQDEEVPLWDETNYYFDKGINYTGFDVKTAGLKYITFTCIATDVVLPYKVTEDDFVYDFEFVKYDKEKKEYVSVKKEDSVRRNYLVGEKFDAQNTKIRYIYKSLKKRSPSIFPKARFPVSTRRMLPTKKCLFFRCSRGLKRSIIRYSRKPPSKALR